MHGLLRTFFCIFVSLSLAVDAQSYTLSEALEKSQDQALSLPRLTSDGCIPTLNHKGFADNRSNPLRLAFMAYAPHKKVLELGGAYGDVMLEVLVKNPDTIYHLSDLDERHLFIAAQRLEASIQQGHTRPKVRSTLRFITHDITQKPQLSDRYDAILVERVFQFLSPTQLESALDHIEALLKPGGRVYIATLSPYIKPYQAFLVNYQRLMAEGRPFPGYITIHQNHEEPLSFLLLETQSLKPLFETRHFKILEAKLFPSSYQSPEWSLDGRENTLLIAEKPVVAGDPDKKRMIYPNK